MEAEFRPGAHIQGGGLVGKPHFQRPGLKAGGTELLESPVSSLSPASPSVDGTTSRQELPRGPDGNGLLSVQPVARTAPGAKCELNNQQHRHHRECTEKHRGDVTFTGREFHGFYFDPQHNGHEGLQCSLWLRSSMDEADAMSSHGAEFAHPGFRGYACRTKGFFHSNVILTAPWQGAARDHLRPPKCTVLTVTTGTTLLPTPPSTHINTHIQYTHIPIYMHTQIHAHIQTQNTKSSQKCIHVYTQKHRHTDSESPTSSC